MSLGRSEYIMLAVAGILIAGVAAVAVVFRPASAEPLGQERSAILGSVPEGYLAFTIDVASAYTEGLAEIHPKEPSAEFPFAIADEHVLTGDPALVLDALRDDARHSNIQVSPQVHITFDYIPGSGWGSMAGKYPAAYNVEGIPLDTGTSTNAEGTTASVVLEVNPATLDPVVIVLGPPPAEEPCRADRRVLGLPC